MRPALQYQRLKPSALRGQVHLRPAAVDDVVSDGGIGHPSVALWSDVGVGGGAPRSWLSHAEPWPMLALAHMLSRFWLPRAAAAGARPPGSVLI